MKLLTFRHNNQVGPGFLVGTTVVDANILTPHRYQSVNEVLGLSAEKLERLIEKAISYAETPHTDGLYELSEVTLEAPVPRPGKIVAVGLNYRDHAEEQGKEPPKTPMIFAKFPTAITSPGKPIVLPPNSSQVDFEAELCVVLGRTGRAKTLAEAMEMVAGYTIINDVSARDMQRQDKQYVRAKSCDTFAPCGPWIVLKDEIPDPHTLAISLTLNGELMQQSNTGNLIFSVPFLIHYLSQSMTFEAGDLIATGTPGGVGVFRQPPVFLKSGDVVSITIEGIGTLTNPVQAEEKPAETYS
ncbi:MAG: fumarylacetoacetate hydrolase family protein [Blastocatellia bacterium]|nr:fumarylacetoacetate hydrolase family protein [Blastocatellia bacterium]